jgi:hypothetical protein
MKRKRQDSIEQLVRSQVLLSLFDKLYANAKKSANVQLIYNGFRDSLKAKKDALLTMVGTPEQKQFLNQKYEAMWAQAVDTMRESPVSAKEVLYLKAGLSLISPVDRPNLITDVNDIELDRLYEKIEYPKDLFDRLTGCMFTSSRSSRSMGGQGVCDAKEVVLEGELEKLKDQAVEPKWSICEPPKSKKMKRQKQQKQQKKQKKQEQQEQQERQRAEQPVNSSSFYWHPLGGFEREGVYYHNIEFFRFIKEKTGCYDRAGAIPSRVADCVCAMLELEHRGLSSS